MCNEPRTITVDPESESGRALAEDIDIVLDREGVTYRVSRIHDPWAGYDANRVRVRLRAVAGMIGPDEAERMKAFVYQGRADGTRPLDRP